MVVGAELHSDEEAFLLERESPAREFVGNQFVYRAYGIGNDRVRFDDQFATTTKQSLTGRGRRGCARTDSQCC